MSRVPSLETERLFLREVTEENSLDYEKYFVDWEVIRFLSSVVPWPYPEGGVSEYIRNVIIPNQGKDKWVWGIFLKSNPNELIGVVDLWRSGSPENRGFWLGRPFWGLGYMTEATQAVTEFAFTELDFDKLVFSNAVGNDRSHRVKAKCGAKLKSRSPASFVSEDFREQEIWELTKEDWLASKS